jgi:nicotinamide mononucleotide transporter PnuC
VAIIQGNVGTWVLSLCIELPMNIAGVFMWRRASTDKTSIAPRRLNWWLRLIIFVVIAGLVAGAFFVFKNENFRKHWYVNPDEHKDWYYVLPDAGLLIIGTAAMTLTLFRFKEIWYLWLIVDSTFVLLNILQHNWALVFSWTGGLICSIYGLLTWKAAKAVSLKK